MTGEGDRENTTGKVTAMTRKGKKSKRKDEREKKS